MAWVDNRPRFGVAVVLGVISLFVVMVGGGFGPPPPVSDGPNVIVILTDDQSYDTVLRTPSAMPYLKSLLEAPDSDWIQFPNAFVNTPICCPSRATILSGQYAHHTGVTRNQDGEYFDDASSVATWLQGAGYHTGLIGKYMNLYPFGREPFIPPGWDEWIAKIHGGVDTVYFNYRLNRNGVATQYGLEAEDYMPDVLAADARTFIRDAPPGRPFFLYFAPTAPHAPWVPAPRHEGAFSEVRLDAGRAPSIEENRIDKPEWVQELDRIRDGKLVKLDYEARNEFEALLGVDDAIRGIVETLRAEGVLEDTVILFLSDNGYSYGEHSVVAKRCAYDECARVPFFVHVPGAEGGEDPFVVSNTDVGPTIAALAGVEPTRPVDGIALPQVVAGAPAADRPGVLLEWAGDLEVPSYWAFRTQRFLFVTYPESGEEELYDLKRDPYALKNVADDPEMERVRERVEGELTLLIPEWGANPGAG